MSVWTKVLIGCVMVASMIVFYMGARALKTQAAWRGAAAKYPPQIDEAKKKEQALKEGDAAAGQPSIRDLQVQLHELLVDRGRVWTDVQPLQAPDQSTGALKVIVNSPDPHQVAANTIVYLFSSAPAGGKGSYLGEYKVNAIEGKNITLLPSGAIQPAHIQRATSAGGPWAMYEDMPADEHQIFAGVDAAQLQALLPPETANEYLRDGKPANPDDPPENVRVVVRLLKDYQQIQAENPQALTALTIPADAKEQMFHSGQLVELDPATAQVLTDAKIAEEVSRIYRRELRDYFGLLHANQNRIADLQLRVADLNAQLTTLKEDLADAQKQQEYHTAEIAAAKAELAELQTERTAVTEYRQKLEARMAELQQSIADVFAQNKQLAAEYAQLQSQAARQVDELTSAAP